MMAGQACARLVHLGAVCAAAALVSGCGSSYRPVITPVNTTGPASQPSSYVVVVSAPAVTSPGIATIVDYSGDTILAEAPIGPGPTTFTIDELGGNGYTLNSDGTLSNFPVSTSLQAKNVTYTTLPTTFQLLNFFTPAAGLLATDESNSSIDVFNSFPQSYKLSIPVAPVPVMIAGSGLVGQRDYAISQGNSQGGNVASGVTCNQSPQTASPGEVDGIEVATYTVSAKIPVGKCPVYALESADTKRLFVLNRGDDTITVINAQNETLDGQFNAQGQCVPFTSQTGATVNCHPVLPLSTAALKSTGVTPPNCNLATNPTCGMTATAGPVFAEYNPVTSQLVVADYDGNAVSVIDVSLDQYGNDSATFGTTFTIPVGNNPASVTALADGSRAYTANQTDGHRVALVIHLRPRDHDHDVGRHRLAFVVGFGHLRGVRLGQLRLGVGAEVLDHSLRDQHDREDHANGQQQVIGGPHQVHPEVAERPGRMPRDAPHQRRREGDARGGRDEVMDHQRHHLGEIGHGGFAGVALPVGVGGEARGGVEGQVGLSAPKPCGLSGNHCCNRMIP